MAIRIGLIAAALALTAAAPASAALVQYNFTAGIDTNGYTRRIGYRPNETPQATYLYEAPGAFGLSATFIVNTAAAPADQWPEAEGMLRSTYDGGAAFMTATMSKTGGNLALGVTSATGDRGIYGARTDDDQIEFSQFTDTNTAPAGRRYEYHQNGNVARSYVETSYLSVNFSDGFADVEFGMLDGVELVVAFNNVISGSPGSLWSYRYFQEYLYDESGALIGDWTEYDVFEARLTGASIGESVSVPGPAMLGLFGLGFLGLTARRRRQAA